MCFIVRGFQSILLNFHSGDTSLNEDMHQYMRPYMTQIQMLDTKK